MNAKKSLRLSVESDLTNIYGKSDFVSIVSKAIDTNDGLNVIADVEFKHPITSVVHTVRYWFDCNGEELTRCCTKQEVLHEQSSMYA